MPCLLLKEGGLVKTVGFKNPRYLGDPINTVRIFNDKEVDELLLLDISPCRTGAPINYELVEEIVSEAFVPVAYGGGIATVEEGRRLLSLGVEKVAINTAAVARPALIDELSAVYGASTVVVAIDVKKKRKKYEVMTNGGEHSTGLDPAIWARQAQARGAGEILVNSIDADGEMSGYDLELVRMVAESVSVPVIACGGAATTADFRAATKQGHASACAAGSMFVYQGRHRAVLISFPTQDELDRVLEVGT
ncbi:MAG: AglZ/HisF2 family acetamidino modification protein [Actinomycetota bacterium]